MSVVEFKEYDDLSCGACASELWNISINGEAICADCGTVCSNVKVLIIENDD
jgi:hypothetical protein